MKIRVIIAFIFLLLNCTLLAQKGGRIQSRQPQNNVYLNFSGVDVSLASLNYERLIFTGSYSFVSVGMGVGYNKVLSFHSGLKNFPDITSYGDFMTLPHHITMNLGKYIHFLEIGLGGTAIVGPNPPENYYLYPLIGYRLHPLQAIRPDFRVYASFPGKSIKNMRKITNDEDNRGLWWFWIGISIGLSF